MCQVVSYTIPLKPAGVVILLQILKVNAWASVFWQAVLLSVFSK